MRTREAMSEPAVSANSGRDNARKLCLVFPNLYLSFRSRGLVQGPLMTPFPAHLPIPGPFPASIAPFPTCDRTVRCFRSMRLKHLHSKHLYPKHLHGGNRYRNKSNSICYSLPCAQCFTYIVSPNPPRSDMRGLGLSPGIEAVVLGK